VTAAGGGVKAGASFLVGKSAASAVLLSSAVANPDARIIRNILFALRS